MRIYCSCQQKARVSKSAKISNLTRGFYIDCKCGRRYYGLVSLEHQIRGTHKEVDIDMLKLLSSLSIEDQKQIIKQYQS